jgi:hypothetical protein
MSALGHKRTLSKVCLMSALPLKADIAGKQFDVCQKQTFDGYPTTSSARAKIAAAGAETKRVR